MEKSKVYISTQLLSVLPPIALKMASFLCNWQNSPKGIMLYEHRFAKTLKMTEEEVRISIQTLINLKLIDLTNIDNKWKIEFNPTEWQKYYKISMDRVIEHEGYKLATEVTYDKEEKKQTTTPDFTNMSAEDMKRTILMMQAMLNEKKQVAELVKMASEPTNDDLGLPF